MSNQNTQIARSIKNQTLPAGGPKFVSLPFNFSATPSFAVDLIQYVARTFIDNIQTAYIDNSTNTSPLVLQFGQPTSQTLTVPAGAEGYFPVLVSEPYFIVSTVGTPSNVTVLFINVPIAPEVWFPGQQAQTFDLSGNLKVADQNFTPYLQPGGLQIQNGGLGNNDTFYPDYSDFEAYSLSWAPGTVSAFDITGAFATLNSFYLAACDIAVSGDASLAAAGEVTFTLLNSTSRTAAVGTAIIAQRTIFLPGAAGTQAGMIPVFSMNDLNYHNKTGVSGYLTLTASVALATGKVTANIFAGNTARKV